ncbi:hypothetical protein C8J57DRAFT_1507683 [Mycena rebaudengoi]|nr:hypothetical protein C8J57DRAFT_1507683 [Mycena rebaudengoi]
MDIWTARRRSAPNNLQAKSIPSSVPAHAAIFLPPPSSIPADELGNQLETHLKFNFAPFSRWGLAGNDGYARMTGLIKVAVRSLFLPSRRISFPPLFQSSHTNPSHARAPFYESFFFSRPLSGILSPPDHEGNVGAFAAASACPLLGLLSFPPRFARHVQPAPSSPFSITPRAELNLLIQDVHFLYGRLPPDERDCICCAPFVLTSCIPSLRPTPFILHSHLPFPGVGGSSTITAHAPVPYP